MEDTAANDVNIVGLLIFAGVVIYVVYWILVWLGRLFDWIEVQLGKLFRFLGRLIVTVGVPLVAIVLVFQAGPAEAATIAVPAGVIGAVILESTLGV